MRALCCRNTQYRCYPAANISSQLMLATELITDQSQLTFPQVSLQGFLDHPLDHFEWVEDQLQEKQAMTAKTGRVQARLTRYWGSYKEPSGQGGEVYTETHCRTVNRVRCPDVAYLPPEMVTQYGDFKVLPQSFPLIAEVVSPTDPAEEVFTKVREYLASSCLEVWLVFPDSQWVMVITAQQQKLFTMTDSASTVAILTGFTIAVADLLA
jgi:Uma2 family endonuclease